MPRLVLKALRDLVAMRVRALLLVFVLAGGMSILAGGFMARRTIYHTRDHTYTTLALADLEVNFKAASDDELPKLDDLSIDPRDYSLIASHLFSSCRMSADERTGVAGFDGAVHGLRGLWVVDASVMPNNLGVNPQHTIMALAMHLARRIAG